ncbi:MAG: hypothetical protein ABSF34_12065, partial [Verrucomicrobiota bacterium]
QELHTLDLQSAGKLSGLDLNGISSLKHLQVLNLSYAVFNPIALRELASLSKLRELYLISTRLGDADLKNLALLQHHQQFLG